MTFFGLTALGPQNVFAATATTYRYLQVFDEEDFKTAWRKVNKESNQTLKTNIGAILTALFRGPIPENDRVFLDNAFDEEFETPETISFQSFLKIMIRLRDGKKVFSYIFSVYIIFCLSQMRDLMQRNMKENRSQLVNTYPVANLKRPYDETLPSRMKFKQNKLSH